MSGFFPDPNIAAALVRLTQSPRVRVGLNSLKGALPMAGGPFSSNPSYGMNNNRLGASPANGGTFKRHGPTQGGTLGSIVAGLFNGPDQQQQQQDPMMDLYNQLLDQLQQPVNMPTGINTQDLMKQVQAAINPIYDQREQRAQAQSDRARGDVKDMYRALSNDYERLAPEQVKQADAAKKQVEDLYGQLRSNVEGSYARVSNEQADLFKQLGIEDALPDVLSQQQAPVNDALTAASENQAQQEQRYMDQGQMDATYYREGSPNATMQGNEISTDLLAQLQDYMQQTEAERTSGIQTSYMDQLGQAQTQLGQQQQAAQGETARRQEMLWQMLQSQLQGNQQQQQLTPDTFMSQLPSQQQQSVAGAFTQLQRSPEAVYGKTQDPRNPVPGTFVDTTPQWYMQQADKMLQNGQIDPVTHQALLMYMQLYFGNK
jgi:hypothetical protein